MSKLANQTEPELALNKAHAAITQRDPTRLPSVGEITEDLVVLDGLDQLVLKLAAPGTAAANSESRKEKLDELQAACLGYRTFLNSFRANPMPRGQDWQDALSQYNRKTSTLLSGIQQLNSHIRFARLFANVSHEPRTTTAPGPSEPILPPATLEDDFRDAMEDLRFDDI